MASPPREQAYGAVRPHPVLGSYYVTLPRTVPPYCIAHSLPPCRIGCHSSAPPGDVRPVLPPSPTAGLNGVPYALPVPRTTMEARVRLGWVSADTYLGPVEGVDHTDACTCILVQRWWIRIWEAANGGVILASRVDTYDVESWLLWGRTINWTDPFDTAMDHLGLSYALQPVPSSIPHVRAPLSLFSGPSWIRLQDVLVHRPWLNLRRPAEGDWSYRARVRRTIGGRLHIWLDYPAYIPYEDSDSEDDPYFLDILSMDRWARAVIRRFLRRIVRRHRTAAQFTRLTEGLLRSLHPAFPVLPPVLDLLTRMLAPRSPALRRWPADIPARLRRTFPSGCSPFVPRHLWQD